MSGGVAHAEKGKKVWMSGEDASDSPEKYQKFCIKGRKKRLPHEVKIN